MLPTTSWRAPHLQRKFPSRGPRPGAAGPRPVVLSPRTSALKCLTGLALAERHEPPLRHRAGGPIASKQFSISMLVGGSLFILTDGCSARQVTPTAGLPGPIIAGALGRTGKEPADLEPGPGNV